MCQYVSTVQLLAAPSHDILVHAVLYIQHLIDLIAIEGLKPVEQGFAQTLKRVLKSFKGRESCNTCDAWQARLTGVPRSVSSHLFKSSL